MILNLTVQEAAKLSNDIQHAVRQRAAGELVQINCTDPDDVKVSTVRGTKNAHA